MKEEVPDDALRLKLHEALAGVSDGVARGVKDADLTYEQILAVVAWVAEAESRMWASCQAPNQELHAQLREAARSVEFHTRHSGKLENQLDATKLALVLSRDNDQYKAGVASRDKEVANLTRRLVASEKYVARRNDIVGAAMDFYSEIVDVIGDEY